MTWPHRRLVELGVLSTGSTPRTSEPRLYGGDIPFVTPGELDTGVPVTRTQRTLTGAGGAEARMLPVGAVMVCCIGSLGKTGIAGSSVATNQQINSVVFDRSLVLPRYGYYACRLLKPRLESMAPATTLPIVSKSRFGELTIPVPPLPEQQRIAEVLDRAEALRAKRRAALAQLDTLTQSIFLDMFGDPFTNPKGLPTAALETLCSRVTDGTHQPPAWSSSGHPFLFVSNIVSGEITFDTQKLISDETHSELMRRCPIEPGDVLYSTVGSYGVPAVVRGTRKFAFQRHIAHLKPDRAVLDPEFLRVMLASPPLRRQADSAARGMAQKTVNLADIRKFVVFRPDMQVQRGFTRRVAAVRKLEAAHRTSLAQLDALFASLQHRAFRGEL